MKKQEFLAMSLPYDLYVMNDLDIVKNYVAAYYSYEFEIGINTYRPILRPLSDFENSGFDIQDEILVDKLIHGNSIGSIPFYLVKTLVENHFDIANLIESGEAIDYRTIKDFVF